MRSSFLHFLLLWFCLWPHVSHAQIHGAVDVSREDIDELKRQEAKIREEIAHLKLEQREAEIEIAEISKRLVSAATNTRRNQEALDSVQSQLNELEKQMSAQSEALSQNREDLSRMISSLVKLARNKPPPLILSPDTSKKAVRTAYIIQDLTSKIEAKSTVIEADLLRLEALREDIEQQQQSKNLATRNLFEAEREIRLLVAEKQAYYDRVSNQTTKLEDKANALAEASESLEAFFEALAKETSVSPRLKPSPPKYGNLSQGYKPRRKPLPPLSSKSDSTGFATKLGAQGIIHTFGSVNELNEKALGNTYLTSANAQVYTPEAGKIVYAGLFRSYGRILIIDIGSGYHILLAGLHELYAKQGQNLSKGEPVGEMAIGQKAQELYFEVRQNGKVINPSRWFGKYR